MAGKYSIDAVFRAIDRFTGPINRMQRKARRFTRSLKTGLTSVNAWADQGIGAFNRVARTAGIAALAVGAIGVKAGMVGANFEEAMSGVGSVMLKSTNQIKVLEDRALQLGKTTKFTATEVAQGMELMARAGFEETDILAGIEGVLSAAAASGMDLAETSSHVSNVLKGMGLEASKATEVADVLALASSKTNSTIGSLAESMRNVASTARQLNIPMKDTVAAVALLQDVGLDASVAGSSLNTMLTKLAKPTAGLKAKMKQMGVAFQTSKGDMLPLMQVMENMAKAAQKSGGNMEQIAFFADLVGLRGQKAAANLKDLFLSGKFSELQKTLEGSAGAAKKMAGIKLENLKGDVTLFKSALDGVLTNLFKMEGGPLRGIVKGMTKWLGTHEKLIAQDFADFIESAKILGDLFGGEFQKQLDTISGLFGDLFKSTDATEKAWQKPGWRTLAIVMGKTIPWLLLGVGALYAVKTAVIATKVVVWLFEAAMAAATVAQKLWTGAMVVSKAVIRAITWLTKTATVQVVAHKVAQIACAVAVRATAAAMALYRAAVVGLAALSVPASLLAMAAPFLAIAAAAGAAYLAVDQFLKLQKEVGGDVGKVFGKFMEGKSLFTAVDESMNEAARAAAKKEGRGFYEGSQAVGTVSEHGTGTGVRAPPPEPQQIEIKITGDTDNVDVPKKPKSGGNVRLRLAPSGAM